MLNDHMERTANHDLARYDVTFSQMRVLVTLNYAENFTCSLKELEKIFMVSQQTMAGIVSRLEKKQLVTAISDQQDKRVKKVKLTQEGQSLAIHVRKQMIDLEEQSLSCLNQEEQETLRRLLLRVYESCK